jgi:branched-subunit amino acid transport protein
MKNYIYFAIIISALATYIPRFLGVYSAKFISIDGKIFKFVTCISYGILTALISRIIIYPVGVLENTATWMRLIVATISIIVLFLTKKNVLIASSFGIFLFCILNYYFY